MNADQEKLLGLIDNEDAARLLADFWRKVEQSPIAAARIVRAIEQSADAIKKITTDIPQVWKDLDEQSLEAELRRGQFIEDLRKFRKETMTELQGVIECIGQLKTAMGTINEDDVLNKANRLIEAAEKLGRLKRDGSLELLKKLL